MEEASGGGEGKGELWQVMEPAFIALALALAIFRVKRALAVALALN